MSSEGPDGDMLWGGRFSGGPHPDMFRLTASIDLDIRLLPYDLRATQAHARVLAKAGLLTGTDVTQVDVACDEILQAFEKGELEPHPRDEDVHTLVERELTERLGDIGARIHAGRSRNDLVAADLRLWTRTQCDLVLDEIALLLRTIADRAEEHAETLMPGYTHLQRAQPVTVGYHLLAHGFALTRDAQRFVSAREVAAESVLGAGALAGNTLGLDPTVAADELEATSTFANAMDAVAQRDFACDFLYACSLCAVHLSRFAEEVVLWTSSEFGFARLPDEWSTGSSMMPQKRNPDLAELLRGWCATSIADLNGMLALLKGLPLAYDRDLQTDKEFLFRTGGRIGQILEAARALVTVIVFEAQALADAATRGASWATDLAEVLVGRGVPFRAAHEASGRLVMELESRDMRLEDADTELLRRIHPKFEAADTDLADPLASIRRRTSRGGPSPSEVAKQIATLRDFATELKS